MSYNLENYNLSFMGKRCNYEMNLQLIGKTKKESLHGEIVPFRKGLSGPLVLMGISEY